MDTNQTSEVFNWKDFKNGKFYVKVTHENIKDFLSECDKRGLKWTRGENALDFIPEFSGKAYIAHDLLRPFFHGLSFDDSIEPVKESGLPFVKWSDFAIESEEQEQEQEETIQPFNWIPCTERLPEKSGNYLTMSTNGRYEVLPYSVYHKAWNAFDDLKTCCPLTNMVAWAEIPPYKRSDKK